MRTVLYRLTSPNGRIYIGVTQQPLNHRLGGHFNSDTAIGAALRKYGRENFKSDILVVGDREYIYWLEEKAIEVFNARVPQGYNLTSGGIGGKHTESSRLKLSLSRKGMVFSDEHRKNLSESHKGYKISDEAKETMVSAQKDRRAKEPDDIRQTMSDKMKRIWTKRSPEERREMGLKRWETRRQKANHG